MRLCVFTCLLLASVAVAIPNGRHKRDLAYLKNLITSAIFGRSQINIQPSAVLQEENGYKLFRLPGYDDVMIKVTPKKPIVEEFVYPPAVEKVNLNAFGTVVGTKSNDDTLVAMKEVDNLLSTGILYEGHNNVMKETVIPTLPSLNTPNYVVEEKIKTVPVIEKRPVLEEVIESRPAITEVIENRPVLTEVIPPVEEKVELKLPFDPTYSYKQIQNNKPMMTYTAHNNPGVEVLETIKKKTELPMCIKKRVDEAIVLGADPNRFAPVQKVFQYQSPSVFDFSYPRVEGNSFREDVAPVQEVFQYQSPSVFDFSYPRVEGNSFREDVAPVQGVFQYQTPQIFDFSYPRVEANSYAQNSFREEVSTEGFGTVADFGFPPQRLNPLKDSPVRYNLRPTKTKAINSRPIPLHSHKSLHFEEDISVSKDKVNSQTRKVQAFNNLGEKVDISQTLGPMPPQYITNVGKKGGNSVASHGNMKQMEAVPIVGSKDNVANAKIPINVYKLQSNPNTGKVAKESNALRTNVKANTNQYVIPPAVNSGTTKKDTAQIKNVVYTNKVTGKAPSVTRPVVLASTNAPKQPLRENIQTPIINKPIVIKNAKNYSYQQNNADGSSMNVNGNRHGVSVSVKQKNNRGRGDIPDQK